MSTGRAGHGLAHFSVLALAFLTAISGGSAAFAYSEGNHDTITRNALPFLVDDVLETILKGNRDEDYWRDEEKNDVRRHAQNCTFRDSADYINDRYRHIHESLQKHPSTDPKKAVRMFGHITHGIQDFYSHSNWIPSAPEGLGMRRMFDDSLGLWPKRRGYTPLFDDVMIIEGAPPAGVTAILPRNDRGLATSAVPRITDRRGGGAPVQYRGLMTSVSGNVSDYPQQCPPVGKNCTWHRTRGRPAEELCLRHSDRESGDGHKTFSLSQMDKAARDTFTMMGTASEGRMNMDGSGGGDWAESRHWAKRQTMHEWCRLLHRSRDFDPTFAEVGLILGTWVAKDVPLATPHIEGTVCERSPGRHLIQISATIAADAGAQMQFVAFRANFKDSVRTQVNANSTKTLSICANDDDTIAASVNRRWLLGPTMHFKVSAIRQTTVATQGNGPIHAAFDVKKVENGCAGGAPKPPEGSLLETNAGFCVDLNSADTGRDGGKVQAWSCHGRANQRWTYDPVRRAIRAASGRCLDVDLPQMTTKGGKVQTWSCNYQKQQQWTPMPDGSLRNGGGLCLDVDINQQRQDGGKVQVWPCNGGKQQKFRSTAF
jgi:hypothetical protein